MKRSLWITYLLVLCSCCLSAAPITKEQAARKASDFVAVRGKHIGSKPQLAYQSSKLSSTPNTPATDSYLYVFNIGDNDGFVMVGGDNDSPNILGYSDQGKFEASEMPENLKSWMESYEEQMAYAHENGIPTAKHAPQQQVSHVVTPLLTSKWSQREPYNLDCFTATGAQAVTGCAAVALAQVMYYFKWPRTATTTIPAYGSWSSLPATTFDWSNMKDAYTGTLIDDSKSCEAVANLVHYCAHAQATTFGASSSPGTVTYCGKALNTYFGYQNPVSRVYRYDYDLSQWEKILLEELDHGRPIIYGGNTSKGTGHAFVIDGYDGQGMYHINWGWGGLADGYFYLDVLNPSFQGTNASMGTGGYTIKQYAFIGINPTVIDDWETESGIKLTSLVLVDKQKKVISEGVTSISYTPSKGLMGVYLYNVIINTGRAAGYDVGVGLYQDGTLVDILKNKTNFTGYSTNGTISLSSFGKNLEDGEYIIKIVNRESGKEEWLPCLQSDLNYCELTLSNGTAKVELVNEKQVTDLKVNSLEQVIDNDLNAKQLIANVVNQGNTDFASPLYLFANDSLVSYESIYLAPNEDRNIRFVFKINAGTYRIKMTTDASGNNVIYNKSSMKLTDSGTLPKLTIVSSEVKNISGDTMYGSLIDGNLVLRNGTSKDYQYNINVRLSIYKGSYYTNINSGIPVHIPAGKTVTVPFSYPVAVGDKFYITIFDPKNTYVKTEPATVAPGFITWTGTGERTASAITSSITVPSTAVAASFEEITDLSTVTITPNSNPNTLYYIRNDATVPTSIKTKNVVKSYEANTIKLSASYDYYVPKRFKATTITYTRTPSLACNGTKGWQTITLPFQVQTVKSSSTAVTWTTPEHEGNFWLRELRYDRDDKLYFSDVTTWIANTPYLIGVPSGLKGKSLALSASNVYVMESASSKIQTSNYAFVGTTATITPKNSYVLNSAGTAFTKSSTANVKSGFCYFQALNDTSSANSTLSISDLSRLAGDVNGDGFVSIVDAMGLVEWILGNNIEIIEGNSDINGDEQINILDVMAIVNIILNY